MPPDPASPRTSDLLVSNAYLLAENKRLRTALQERWTELCSGRAKLATLDSEREANARLTAEVERLQRELAEADDRADSYRQDAERGGHRL